MSVEGPSYATGPIYRFDDNREAVDSSSDRSSGKSSNFARETNITSAFIANFKGPPSPLELCLPVIQGTEEHPQYHEIFQSNYDPNSPSVVTNRVNLIVQRWGRVVPIHPVEFLKNILRKRGYREEFFPALSPEVRKLPTLKQLEDYDNEIVWAIRNSDVKKLEELRLAGKSLSACNRYSESVVHMACRRAEKEIVQFLIQHSADLSIVDDYGRTPLHDACWRPEPRFDIVTMILDVNSDLIRLADMRGSIALNYVREEHWVLWCAYLFNQIEKYWPLRRSSALDSEHVAKRQRVDDSNN